MSPTALVICGGGRVRRDLPLDGDAARVIAADGGVAEALRLGLTVDVLVGDMDSAAPVDAERILAAGGEVERHDPDKDSTDLELAVGRAVSDGATRVVVAGGDGGRLDHLLGNLTLLAAPRWASIQIDAVFGAALLHVIRDTRDMTGEPGELVSLFALGGPATGVSTSGLRWALADATLVPGDSLGVSNEFTDTRATVRVGQGAVVAVRPGVEP
jgi:thiamine pyrophosphokinase